MAFLGSSNLYQYLFVFPPKERYTLVNWFPFDTGSPAATVVASSHFQKLRCKLDIVKAILYNLYASFTCVIFCPGITIQIVPLLTGMSEICAT